jgi:hypothetical protein
MRTNGQISGKRWVTTAIACAAALTGLGCHQNFYYYGEPPYGPPVKGASSLQVGSICDVPTTVVDNSTRSSAVPPTTISSSSLAPRVIRSQPDQAPSRLSWKRADPDGGPTTTVEGSLDSSVVR